MVGQVDGEFSRSSYFHVLASAIAAAASML
jgi:hypothetical protein